MAKELSTIRPFTDEEVEDLTQKCLNFAELFVAIEFYPYQLPLAKAIVTDVIGNYGNIYTGLFSRQSGKSETVANTAGALMVIIPKLANVKDEFNHYVFPQLKDYRKGFWIGIFSPSTTQSSTTYKRLRDRVTGKEGREILMTPELALDGTDSLWPPTSNKSDYLELNNGSFCLMMSADKQSKIESKTFHLILLDEAQDLDEFVVNKSVMPMGAATNATVIATGTPSITKGFFYNTIEFNKIEQIRQGRRDKRLIPHMHFENDYKIVEKYNPNYKKYVAKERKKLGYDSDEFRMAYRLHWLFERGMAVTKELFDELTRKSLNIVTSNKQDSLVAGLDFGKTSDSTVLTVGKPFWDEPDESGRCPVEILNWWEKLGDDYETIFPELKEQVSYYNIQTMACDATGVGEPLVNRLSMELPHITIIPVKFSSQSKDHLYKFFLLMLQEKHVWWPGHNRVRRRNYFKMFESQMLNLQKEYKGQYLTCHAPEDQRNAHDDFCDSLALMMWCINEEAMPYVQTSDGDFYHGQNWHNPKQEFSLRG